MRGAGMDGWTELVCLPEYTLRLMAIHGSLFRARSAGALVSARPNKAPSAVNWCNHVRT